MTIRTSCNIHNLIGIGEEWLLDSDGELIAIFYDGRLKGSYRKSGNTEVTV